MAILSYFFGKHPIYKEDVKSGGWVVHYKEHKGIRGQGATKKEALDNLDRDLKYIQERSSNESVKPSFGGKHQVAHP